MAISPAGMAADSWVLLIKVVVRLAPFHLTTEAATKLLPLTIRVKAGAPATAPAGESAVIEGTGFVVVTVTAGLVAARLLLLLRKRRTRKSRGPAESSRIAW